MSRRKRLNARSRFLRCSRPSRAASNMCSPIKLISTDFDGTLFAEFENPPIPDRLQQLLADLQTRGAKWIINTGRDMSRLLEALARARIPTEPDFLVLGEREIYRHSDSQYVPVEEWNSACARAHGDLFARVRRDIPRIVAWISERFHARLYEDTYSPFCLIAGNNGDADIIHDYLKDYCRGVPGLALVRNDVYARFHHQDFDKGTALAEITRRLGLGPAGVFAVGDQLNDLPMLTRQYAHWLATPANAIDYVKDVVRRQDGFVSDLSHGHGVADALQACLARSGQP
jgi:hydroxymethylpyrimidine pyrophosphatase-like HAD family hydrolase